MARPNSICVSTDMLLIIIRGNITGYTHFDVVVLGCQRDLILPLEGKDMVDHCCVFTCPHVPILPSLLDMKCLRFAIASACYRIAAAENTLQHVVHNVVEKVMLSKLGDIGVVQHPKHVLMANGAVEPASAPAHKLSPCAGSLAAPATTMCCGCCATPLSPSSGSTSPSSRSSST